MHWTECGIRSICPRVKLGGFATGGFLECFNAEHSTKPERIHTMDEYYSLFLFTMVALIVVFVWLERDAF